MIGYSFSTSFRCVVSLLASVSVVSGFTSTLIGPTTSSSTQLHSSPGPQSLEELLSTPSLWDPIKTELNQVPVFACANDQSQPLQYNVGDNPMAFFFMDIHEATKELEKAKVETNLDGLQLIPFPLGDVYEMGVQQMAIVIPSLSSLEDAGAPPGSITTPIGQQVPLFGCMDVQQDIGNGVSMTPLFTSMAEATDAMNMALDGVSEEDKKKFDVTVMPLTRAVQMQASTPDKSFTYVPPMSSIDFLKSSM